MPRDMLIQTRYGTTAQWEFAETNQTDNYILEMEEEGVDTDLNIYKHGDGVTPWSGLVAYKRFLANALVTIGAIEITYAALAELARVSELLPEQVYSITDYRTMHRASRSSIDMITHSIEPLYVKAHTLDKLYPNAISTLYPEDIIKYDLNSLNGELYGCITYRFCPKAQIEAFQDWRNSTTRLWESSLGNSTYTSDITLSTLGTEHAYLDLPMFDPTKLLGTDSGIQQVYLSASSPLGEGNITDRPYIYAVFFSSALRVRITGDQSVNVFEGNVIDYASDSAGIWARSTVANVTVGCGCSDIHIIAPSMNLNIGNGCTNLTFEQNLQNVVINPGCKDLRFTNTLSNCILFTKVGLLGEGTYQEVFNNAYADVGLFYPLDATYAEASHTLVNAAAATLGHIELPLVLAGTYLKDDGSFEVPETLSHAASHFSTDPLPMTAWHGVEITRPAAFGALPANLTSTTFILNALAFPFNYYYQGLKRVVDTVQTVIIETALGSGLSPQKQYFIYFNAAGTLTCSDTFNPFLNTAVFIATVYWNGTNYGIVNDERHAMSRNVQDHEYTHKTLGTRYDNGLAFIFTGTTNVNSTFAVSAGTIWDEDIRFDTVSQTTCRLWHQTAASTASFIAATSTLPYYWNAGLIAKNGTTYAEIVVGTTRFVNFWLYASTSGLTSIHVFAETLPVGNTTGYATAAAARLISPPSLTAFGLSAEWKLLGRIVVKGDGAIQVADPTKDDFRTATAIPGGGSVVMHDTTFPLLAAAGVGYGHIALPTVPAGQFYKDDGTFATVASGAIIGTISGSPFTGSFTCNFNIQLVAKATYNTTGAGTLTLTAWASVTVSVTGWLLITRGSSTPPGNITLGANILSAGGLMSTGDYLPNSGISTTDAYAFTWDGANWILSNILFDIRT